VDKSKIARWSALLFSTATLALVYWKIIYLPEPNKVIEQVSNTEKAPDQKLIVETINNTTLIKEEDNRLTFSIDAETFSFPLKHLEINPFSLPDKSATYLYAKLSERALNGEVVPARLLSDLISGCGETFINENDHKHAMERLTKDKLYPSADPKFSNTSVPDDMVELAADQFEKKFRQCKGLTVSQRGESLKWAKIAANGGDFLGLQMVASHPDTPNSEKITLYEKQWSEYGYIHAPTAITAALSGFSSFSSFKGLEPDFKKAYAYFLISKNIEVAIARYRGKDSNAITEMIADQNTYESILTSKLSAREHLEAEELAKEIMRRNTKCCAIDPRASVQISTSH